MKQKAVIFDLDGVICHTDHFHYQAWKTIAERERIYFDEQINDRLRGVSRMESLEIILERAARSYSPEEKNELAEQKNTLYRAMLEQMTPKDLSEDARHTLWKLRERHVLLAIGSSSKNTGLILEQLGLNGFFDAVSDGVGLHRTKPDPEVFLRAAELLGVSPEECIVVEDAAVGVEAAHRGGMRAAAYGRLIEGTDAEYRLSALSDLINFLDEGRAPQDYDSRLAALRAETVWETRRKLNCCFKNFPGQREPCRVDPLVLEQFRKEPKRFTVTDTFSYSGVPVGSIRQTDGWNNFNVVPGQTVTEKVRIPGEKKEISCEIYYPKEKKPGKRPLVLFFHGGGFVSGSVSTVRNPCRALAAYADAVVVNLDYSLAPEHPFPIALEEGKTVLRWLVEHTENYGADPLAIAVSGDSAGGHLAATLARDCNLRGEIRIGFQALFYPVIFLLREEEERLCPWTKADCAVYEDDRAILSSLDYIRRFTQVLDRLYLQGAQEENLLSENSLHCAPETFLVAAEYDYLCKQDGFYAAALADAGKNVRMIVYRGINHAFLDQLGYYPQAEDSVFLASQHLKDWYSSIAKENDHGTL